MRNTSSQASDNFEVTKATLFDSANSREVEGFGPDEWFTTDEAAAFLKVSPFSLRNMTSNGHIPYQKLLRRNRYRKSDLVKLLTSTRKGGFRGN